MKAQFYYLKGNSTAYHDNTEMWRLLQDSVITAEKNEQLSALLIAREIDLKEGQLAAQDAQMQQDAIDIDDLQTQRNLIVAIGVVIAIALLLGVWWLVHEKRQKALIGKMLVEKEVLLREVHHRVKNNLQIVSGLLQIQRDKVDHPELQQVLTDAETRIRTMAMVGDKLHGKDLEASVNFKKYLEDLLDNLAMTYSNPITQVRMDLDCPEVHLDMNTSIPLGFIVNELVSNAYKHAFQDREQGLIGVRLEMNTEGGYRLIVRDDGVGLGKDLDNLSEKHLGVSLIRGLAQQLKGEMTFKSSDKGAVFSVTFKESVKRN